jgi:hydroxymethylglutaryl-CoA reductase (NADPH)
LAGSFSQNMQAANVVAAFFLATGQDMAHLVEASQVSSSFEKEGDGLYVAVDMPNINLGTVGGGTWLDAQKEARLLISPEKELSPLELAEVLAVAVLAGEISGMAALSSKTLAKAHKELARSKNPEEFHLKKDKQNDQK